MTRAKLRYYTDLGTTLALGAARAVTWRQDDETYLRSVYRHVLRRDADPDGLRHFLDRARRARSPWRWRARTLLDFMRGAEFKMAAAARAYGQPPLHAHHAARIIWVRTRIPAARQVLDLGGSASFDVDGALLAMEYPHRPEAITIVDFPPADRVANSHSTLTESNHVAKNGSRINFVYDSFVNLQRFADASFDLVVAGQVIEHVTEAEGEHVLREVMRVLTPGGRFCLDTPNRGISALLVGDGFLHPEHKLEYQPEQLARLAEKVGFRIVDVGGISPMPRTARRRRFEPGELAANVALCDRPELGFSFFLGLEKPRA